MDAWSYSSRAVAQRRWAIRGYALGFLLFSRCEPGPTKQNATANSDPAQVSFMDGLVDQEECCDGVVRSCLLYTSSVVETHVQER